MTAVVLQRLNADTAKAHLNQASLILLGPILPAFRKIAQNRKRSMHDVCFCRQPNQGIHRTNKYEAVLRQGPSNEATAAHYPQ